MRSSHVCSVLASLVLLWLGNAAAQKAPAWKTLSDTILYCDVRLTSDGIGLCLPDIKMDNCTNIPEFFPQGNKNYSVNGVPTVGWFSVDYNGTELSKASLKQAIDSRTPRFDSSFFPILAVEDVQSKFKPRGIWVNIQHDSFYSQFNLSMRSYIISVSNEFYDPLAEYLSFIDNGAFSVDGVLTDFPVTPSAAIGKPLIISHNGASGDYPDCTDLAYQKAVDDGADVIDCPVQVTKDGIPICMSSINLMDDTNVARSQFASQIAPIKDFQSVPGVFTFNLTWDDIVANLKPQISRPCAIYSLDRNPRYRNAGNFMRLSDFLDFTKDKGLSGIMISIEHAAFVAAELGFDVVDAVLKALDDAGYNNQTTQKVMIQSTNSSVLMKFKQQTKYDLVYMVSEEVRDASPSSLADLKKFASAVSVNSSSIFPDSKHFIMYQTNLVQTLHTAGLSVYVYTLMNEFASQPYDFFSDATAQINAYVQGVGVDGLITDFPATARRYKLNNCMNMGKNTPNFMSIPPPGGLLPTMTQAALPPALAPMPLLTGSDVVEPPLPSARSNHGTAPTSPSRASRTHSRISRIVILVAFAMLCAFCPLV
ncbi:hypothetical protein PR202_ga19982 [Eleusine coracana subsp. coracana]|uniref:glycerophosphodiester phosphodiesterase n=1 Tax=Eleusine coracana subsp. coracana TaxID=191504 RepID=A0AAV5CVX7_ELECO|nr:hypothetical protein PR202_ga19982 [Eleusine coracana subsp. coracana]